MTFRKQEAFIGIHGSAHLDWQILAPICHPASQAMMGLWLQYCNISDSFAKEAERSYDFRQLSEGRTDQQQGFFFSKRLLEMSPEEVCYLFHHMYAL